MHRPFVIASLARHLIGIPELTDCAGMGQDVLDTSSEAPGFGFDQMADDFIHNFSDVDLDGPFPDVDTTRPEVNGELLGRWKTLAKNDNLTVQQLIDRVTPRRTLVGSPTQVAAHFQTWLATEASDGLILTPTLFPGDLDDSWHSWCPSCSGAACAARNKGHTLREHLGLKRPAVPTRAMQGDR